MGKRTLACFGEIDSANLEEYYETELTLDDQPVQVDINFEEQSINDAALRKLSHWLSRLPQLDELGLITVKEDFKSGEIVKEYIEYHLNELDGDDVQNILSGAKTGQTKEEKLLSAIKLKRVGFYPHAEERFVNLDYSLDDSLTNQLIVLDFTGDGQLHHITWES